MEAPSVLEMTVMEGPVDLVLGRSRVRSLASRPRCEVRSLPKAVSIPEKKPGMATRFCEMRGRDDARVGCVARLFRIYSVE